MQNDCYECLFFDGCDGDHSCDDFCIGDEDVMYAETAAKLHSEYYCDYQRYLKEFYE